MEKLQRILLFLIGCMGARFALVYLAYALPPSYLPWMGVGALIIASGFALIFVNGWRKTGLETGGERIWWNHLRPVHAVLWFSFALLALMKQRTAWILLLLDTLLGLTAFVLHHMSIFN
jgi:hypothetical protein